MIRPIRKTSGPAFRIAGVSTLVAAFLTLALAAQAGAQPIDPDPPVNMGEEINTPYSELLPLVSPDGSTLYFIRKNYPENTGGVRDPDDIYFSNRTSGGKWGMPKNIGPPLNSPGSDALMWLSEDGNTALVHSGREAKGKEIGLAISHRTTGGAWGEPQKISIEGLDDLGDYYQATLSPDGRHMMFSRNDHPEINKYDFDLFYAPRISDDMLHWGKPVKLAFELNTPYAEAAPYIGPDGRTLYFCSDRPGSYGSGNIFVSRRTGDDWLEWTTPRPLGEDVNSPFYDAGLTIHDSTYYIARVAIREMGGFGRLDLYTRTIESDIRQGLDFRLAGRLVDKTTGKGVEGEVRISVVSTGKKFATTISDKTGAFLVTLMPGWVYKVVGSAPGYKSGGTTIDFRQSADKPVYDLKIDMVPGSDDGTDNLAASTRRIVPPTVHFPTGSSELTTAAVGELRKFYNELEPAIAKSLLGNIRLVGHTDNVGDSEDNLTLSTKRAEAVRAQLARLGVPTSLMSASGEGETAPVASNETAAGRVRNRRVDILISLSPPPRLPDDENRNPIPFR